MHVLKQSMDSLINQRLAVLPDRWMRDDGTRTLAISRTYNNGPKYHVMYTEDRDILEFLYNPRNNITARLNRYGNISSEDAWRMLLVETNMAIARWCGAPEKLPYQDGMLHGHVRVVIDGITHDCHYARDRLHGMYKRYDSQGRIIYKAVYKHGSKKRQYC